MQLGTATANRRLGACIKWRRVDNFLPKSEGGVSLFPMPNRTCAMSTAMIHERAKPFRLARRFGAVDFRLDNGRRFLKVPRERAPPKIKLAPGRV